LFPGGAAFVEEDDEQRIGDESRIVEKRSEPSGEPRVGRCNVAVVPVVHRDRDGHRESRAIEPLLAMLHDRDANNGWQIVVALGNFPTPPVEEQLISTLDDAHADIETRANAAFTLGRFSGDRAINGQLAALQSDEPRIVGNAVAGLRQRHDALRVSTRIEQALDRGIVQRLVHPYDLDHRVSA